MGNNKITQVIKNVTLHIISRFLITILVAYTTVVVMKKASHAFPITSIAKAKVMKPSKIILSQKQRAHRSTEDSKMDGIQAAHHIHHRQLAYHNNQMAHMVLMSIDGN